MQIVAITGPRLTQRRPRKLECRGDDALEAAGRVGPLSAGQQRFDLEPERLVAGDGHLEESGALRDREIEALVEEHFDPLALGGVRDHFTAPRFRRISTTSTTGIASTTLPLARSVVARKSEL